MKLRLLIPIAIIAVIASLALAAIAFWPANASYFYGYQLLEEPLKDSIKCDTVINIHPK